jgi:hypothetical protein
MQEVRRYVGSSLLAIAAVAATLAALAGSGHLGWLIAFILVAALTLVAGIATMVPDLVVSTHRGKPSAPPLQIDGVKAQRHDIKAAISSYLKVAQHLQTQLHARYNGREVADIPVMVEEIWLARDQVDVLCSEALREPLEQHAYAMNEVARHGERHPDWWSYVHPYQRALLSAIREELR